jgi:cytochrome c oxidase subunit 2
MLFTKKSAALAALVAGSLAFAGLALADQPREWQLNLQPSASPLMDRIHGFHNMLLWIIILISLFVLGLLVWVLYRYNEKANPVATRTTHNTMLEVVWIAVPTLILVVVAIFSFPLLYYSDRTPEAATLTIKARGHQWYWSYVYENAYKAVETTRKERDGKEIKLVVPADEAGRPADPAKGGKPVDLLKDGRFVFDSRIACRGGVDQTDKKACDDFEKARGRKPVRLLDVNEDVVIPVGEYVRVLVIGMDVIHAWTIPAMGAKVDAVPGRVNEIWIYASRPGIFYGQCSELCGRDHGFMPIAVRAVPRPEFERWLAEAQRKFDKVEEPKKAEAPAQGRLALRR